jgi:hypothetical protein
LKVCGRSEQLIGTASNFNYFWLGQGGSNDGRAGKFGENSDGIKIPFFNEV